MVQLCDFLGFAFEAFEGFFDDSWSKLIGAQELDGDVAFQVGIEGLIDNGHAAFAEFLDEVISTDG